MGQPIAGGNPEWTRDRLGRWSRKFYDALQHVVATQDALNRIITYDWCNCGSLDGLTDQNGNSTTWTRDIQGRVTDKIYADNTRIHYTFEATTSRLASTLDAKGQSTNYQYFLDNNLKQVSYTNAEIATPTVSYTYDPNYNRLATMTDGTGLTSFAYKPIAPPALGSGRLGSIDGPFANDTITLDYDELGRTNGRSINGSDNASSVQYDSLGRVQSVTDPLGTFGYTYVNATGRVDHVDLPNEQKTLYAYFDNLGDQRLKQIKNLDAATAIISQFDYTYDVSGQIKTWTQGNSGMANPQQYSFGYDGADQLRSAGLTDTLTQASVHHYNYDYDRAGNRQTTQSDGAVTTSAPNSLNQITSESSGGKMHFRGRVDEPAAVTVAGNVASVDAAGNFDGVATVNVGTNTVPVIATDASGNSRTNNYQVTVPSGANKILSYDLDGNLTSDGEKTYEWDGANRLFAVNYTGTTDRSEFSYDGLSRVVKIVEKTDGTIAFTRKFVWCGQEICEFRDATDAVTQRNYPQGQSVGTTAYFYTRDHLGSIREMFTGGGTVVARYDYDPYGRSTTMLGTTPTDFNFTGLYRHAKSNLDLAVYRTYDPDLGRWLNRDPIAEADGLNLYAFVSNDPINRSDSSGLTGEYWTEMKSPDRVANYDTQSIIMHMIYRGNAKTPPAKAIWTRPCGADRILKAEAIQRPSEDSLMTIEGRDGVLWVHSRYAMIDFTFMGLFNSVARFLCQRCP